MSCWSGRNSVDKTTTARIPRKAPTAVKKMWCFCGVEVLERNLRWHRLGGIKSFHSLSQVSSRPPDWSLRCARGRMKSHSAQRTLIEVWASLKKVLLVLHTFLSFTENPANWANLWAWESVEQLLVQTRRRNPGVALEPPGTRGLFPINPNKRDVTSLGCSPQNWCVLLFTTKLIRSVQVYAKP